MGMLWQCATLFYTHAEWMCSAASGSAQLVGRVSAVVQRAAAAASTACFFSPAAFLAITLDIAACSAGAAAFRIRGWAARVVLHLTGTLNWNA